MTIFGPIICRPGLIAQFLFGATDTEAIIEAVNEAAKNASVQAVLLDVDSPGGFRNPRPINGTVAFCFHLAIAPQVTYVSWREQKLLGSYYY